MDTPWIVCEECMVLIFRWESQEIINFLKKVADLLAQQLYGNFGQKKYSLIMDKERRIVNYFFNLGN
jgi:hypothetical protein